MAQVLLLEPDSFLAGHIKQFFTMAGHRLSIHSDPQAAITGADTQIPDAVITELQLAGRSGAEFLYEFRSYPDWQSIPVIIFTNLHPEQIAPYADILAELNIFTCLRKSEAGLEQLMEETQSAILYAKV